MSETKKENIIYVNGKPVSVVCSALDIVTSTIPMPTKPNTMDPAEYVFEGFVSSLKSNS